MSAGTGITHSEFNPSQDELVHLLQVWVLPKKQGIEPVYNQKLFSKADRGGHLLLMVSPDGFGQSFAINQDIYIYGSFLNEHLRHSTNMKNIYIHVYAGELEVNGEFLHQGDGAAITDITELNFNGVNAEFLMFEMN